MANVAWARRNGIPEAKLTEIDHYWDSQAFSEREKAILKLADWHAHRSQGRMDEATLQFVRQQFSVPEIVEVVCYFAMVTGFQKFNSVFQIEYGCPLPESGTQAHAGKS